MLRVRLSVVVASVPGSVTLTTSLTRDLDAESPRTEVLIAVIVPSIVTPLAVSSLIWLIVHNHPLLVEVGRMNRRTFLGHSCAPIAASDGRALSRSPVRPRQ